MSNNQTSLAVQKLLDSTENSGLHHLPKWLNMPVESIIPGVTQIVEEVRAQFKALEESTQVDWQGLMIPLEKLGRYLSEPISRIGHLQAVDFKQERQEAYDEVRPLVVALQTEMGQSQKIYQRVLELHKNPALTKTQSRIVEETLKGMQRSGVHLEGEQKATFQALKQELAELQQKFQNQLVKEAQTISIEVTDPEEVKGLPDSILKAAAEKASESGADKAPGWSFSVSGANYVTILEQAESSRLRERMYRAFKSRGTSEKFDNRPILERILRLRQTQSRLLGFKHFSDFSLDRKMAPSIESVHQLMNELKQASIPAAERELAELKAFIVESTDETEETLELKPWDVTFWVERYRQAHYQIDQEKIREYLQVPRVMQSLFDLMEKLFDIEIEAVSDGAVPVWHVDVQFYLVKEAGEVIAGFYMDPYERTGLKREGAWMNTVVDRSEALAPEGEEVSLPVALFVMNAREPNDGQPGLFSLNEAETLFHEFGHALQHMLTRVNDGSASGINLVEWDAVEIASQFNENWLYQKTFLESVSAHVETGEPLDQLTIENILNSRHYWAGNAMLRQLLFALTDLTIHEQVGFQADDEALEVSPYVIEKRIRDELIQTPFLPEETQLPAFSHLFSGGYAAGYYSYKWAEVMAADAFSLFEELTWDDEAQMKCVAKKYRDTILAKGGSRPALEIFRQYRGRDATVDALLRQQGLMHET